MVVMHPKICLSNTKGFTLIEIMATLVIISVISSVGVQKYDEITHTANQRVLEVAFSDLNSRELLT